MGAGDVFLRLVQQQVTLQAPCLLFKGAQCGVCGL